MLIWLVDIVVELGLFFEVVELDQLGIEVDVIILIILVFLLLLLDGYVKGDIYIVVMGIDIKGKQELDLVLVVWVKFYIDEIV